MACNVITCILYVYYSQFIGSQYRTQLCMYLITVHLHIIYGAMPTTLLPQAVWNRVHISFFANYIGRYITENIGRLFYKNVEDLGTAAICLLVTWNGFNQSTSSSTVVTTWRTLRNQGLIFFDALLHDLHMSSSYISPPTNLITEVFENSLQSSHSAGPPRWSSGPPRGGSSNRKNSGIFDQHS